MKLYRIGLLLFMVLGFAVESKLLAYQSYQGLEEIEKYLTVAKNSPNHYVLEKSKWETLKKHIESDREEILKTQDSLLRIIDQRFPEAVKVQPSPSVYPTVVNAKKELRGALVWIFVIFFGLTTVFGGLFFFKLKGKYNDAHEIKADLELRYEESKKYWIAKERQLKRELIDSHNKMEELQKQLEKSQIKS